MESPAAACGKVNVQNLEKINGDDWKVTVSASIENGGGTGQEYPDNLKYWENSAGHKWLDNKSREKTWIEAEFLEPTQIAFLQLKSANDCPGRDPYEIKIEIKEDIEGDYELIGHFDNIKFYSRYEVRDFNINSNKKIKFLKINILRNKSFAENNTWNNEIGTQLGQVIFYK